MNAEATAAGTIEVATIQQIIAGEVAASPLLAGLWHVEDLAEGTAYLRKAPFQIDAGEIDADQRALIEEYFTSRVAYFEPVRHFRVDNALVAGQGAVIAADAFLIRESAAEFLASGMVPNGLVGLGDNRFGLGVTPAARIEQPSLLLKRPWYLNYGHWLVDSAAMLSLAAGLTMPPDWQIVIGPQYTDRMRAVVGETLALLAPGVPVLEQPDDQVWRFTELHYVSPVHVPPLFKLPVGLASLRAHALRGRLTGGGPRRAIYVSRGTIGHRVLANEDAVIALCCSLGMEVVSPEQLSLVGQASLFHGAALIVGVKGAALTNTLFCTPRTHLVVLSPSDFPDPFYWDLVAQSGVNYSEQFGRVLSRDRGQGQNPFAIDIHRLRAVLTACLNDIASI